MSVVFTQTRRSIKTNYRRSAGAPPLLEDHKQPRKGMKFHAFEETWETTIDEANPAPGVTMLMKQEIAGEVYTYVDNVDAEDRKEWWATTETFDLVIHDKVKNIYHRLNLARDNEDAE